MKYRKIIDTEFQNEPKSIGVVGEAWGGGFTTELQLQVEQDGGDTAIDLSLEECKILYDTLGEWLRTHKII